MTREEALDWIKARKEHYELDDNCQPLAEALGMAIEALEQEPCEDWHDIPSEKMTLEQARQAVKDLRKKLAEHLEQKPKRRHWIFTKTIFDKHGCTVECSSCHKKWKTYDEIRWKKENNFCPNCGANMIEPQESEDK